MQRTWSARSGSGCGSGGVEQFQRFLVGGHVLAEGNGRGLCAADQMHPAPWVAGGVELLHDGLVMLEGVHFGETVVADDIAETLHQRLRIVTALHVLL